MLTIESTKVYGFEEAIRGMRNPLNSWSKSDSWFCSFGGQSYHKITGECCDMCDLFDLDELIQDHILGPNDKDLMKRLASAGKDHAKYRRMIVVYADVTAPLYW